MNEHDLPEATPSLRRPERLLIILALQEFIKNPTLNEKQIEHINRSLIKLRGAYGGEYKKIELQKALDEQFAPYAKVVKKLNLYDKTWLFKLSKPYKDSTYIAVSLQTFPPNKLYLMASNSIGNITDVRPLDGSFQVGFVERTIVTNNELFDLIKTLFKGLGYVVRGELK